MPEAVEPEADSVSAPQFPGAGQTSRPRSSPCVRRPFCQTHYGNSLQVQRLTLKGKASHCTDGTGR